MLAVSANKDVAGVVAPLAPLADVVYATRQRLASAAPTAEVVGRGAGRWRLATSRASPSVAEAIAAARAAAAPGDLVLVTGSLFTVADAKRALDRS